MDVECPLCGGRGQVAARPVEPLRYRIAPGGCA